MASSTRSPAERSPTWAEAPRADLSKKRQREIVIIAFCCAPSQGSEAGTGWGWAKAASKVGHVTLITPSNGWRRDIQQAIADEELAITPYWINTPEWLGVLLPGRILGTLRYFLWQALAGVAVRRLERHSTVDVVHHVSFSSDSLPSALLASRAPVRVWGPVGGVTRSTMGLYRYLTPWGVLGEVARDVANGILRATTGRWLASRATLILALNDDAREHWRRGRTPVVVESGTALERHEVGNGVPIAAEDYSDHRTALFVGRLIPWKGLLLAVESLRYAPDWRLVVFGEGPDREPAARLATRLGLVSRVDFRGQVARNEVLKALRRVDCLLFPSFHEASGWVAGEASAQGCPVVCLDAGGSAHQAGRNAHVVPIVPERSLPQRIGERLQGLAGRGLPDDHLLADRIPVRLEEWYSGKRPRG